MKSPLYVLLLFVAVDALTAAQTLVAEDVGVSIRVPDNWTRKTEDTFGLVFAPPGEQHKKIRIHLTAHKGIPPEEALQRSANKIDEFKKESGHTHEQVLSSTPLRTANGIKGQKAIVGHQGFDGPHTLIGTILRVQTDASSVFVFITMEIPSSPKMLSRCSSQAFLL